MGSVLLQLPHVQYDIAAAVRLSLAAVDPHVARAVDAALDPWGPAEGSASPDVTIEQLRELPRSPELQKAAGDSLTTASDEHGFYVVADGRWCRVPLPASEGPFQFAFEHGFPVDRVFGRFIRPALQVAAGAQGVATVHGAAVVLEGRGVVIAGWSESGKTETALALIEQGARFLSDKWTLAFPDGGVACFPVSVGIRRWMLRYAPTLRRALPAAPRLQFAMATLGSAVVRATALAARNRGGAIAKAQDALDQIVTLADRAALAPSELCKAYGQPPPIDRAPLGALVLLRTTARGAPFAEPRDAVWAARRLVRSASYERRGYLDLARRARYIHADTDVTRLSEIVEQREERQLLSALEGIPIIDVQAPFPYDPRHIVNAIRPLL
jgi:hypothetical protein